MERLNYREVGVIHVGLVFYTRLELFYLRAQFFSTTRAFCFSGSNQAAGIENSSV